MAPITASKTLEDYLKQRKNEIGSESQPDWEERKVKWLKSLDGLFKQINDWLSPLSELGLGITRDRMNVLEEHIGHYEVPIMRLVLGDATVVILPKGTNVLGAFGRVDLRGKNGSMMLVMTEWNQWSFFDPKKNRLMGAESKFDSLTQNSFEKAVLALIQD